MSRHDLLPLSDLARPVEVSCGWDAPLQTFFLQVMPAASETETRPLLWMGAGWREHLDPTPILAAARFWAIVHGDLEAQLITEQAADLRPAKPPLLSALDALRQRAGEA